VQRPHLRRRPWVVGDEVGEPLHDISDGDGITTLLTDEYTAAVAVRQPHDAIGVTRNGVHRLRARRRALHRLLAHLWPSRSRRRTERGLELATSGRGARIATRLGRAASALVHSCERCVVWEPYAEAGEL
jgi:hypothetical protein